MRPVARHIVTPAAFAALLGLTGCIGAPAPGPVAYTPGYAPPPNPAYVTPGYSQGQGYAPSEPTAAPAPAQVAYGSTCYAGVYTCQLPQSIPVGAQCSCPGLGAPSYGNVR
jgi:hypothetical protein